MQNQSVELIKLSLQQSKSFSLAAKEKKTSPTNRRKERYFKVLFFETFSSEKINKFQHQNAIFCWGKFANIVASESGILEL